MAAYTQNDGNQTITFRYLQDATSFSFNNLLREIMKPGIYEGGLLSIVDDTTVEVAPYTAIVYASNDDTVAIRVRTSTEYNVAVSSTEPVLVLTYEWHSQETNYVQAQAMSWSQVNSEDPTGELYVVIGEAQFSGTTLTGFDYSTREQVTKDADTMLLGDTYSVNSTPIGGTPSQFTGDATYLTEVIEDLYNRLIDLSGVGDDAVKNRHVDKTVNTGIHGDNINIGSSVPYEGATPGTFNTTTTITTTLASIVNQLKDLSGVNDDAVNTRHIDFGTGTNQVSLRDFVAGLSKTQTIAGDFPDISYTVSTPLENILNQILSTMSSMAVQINENTAEITALQNRALTIENKTIFNDLPVGTMMMFDATGWVNDSTIPGWFACDGTNGTPNLIDRFIKGHSSGSHDADSANNLGGSASVKLQLIHLPEHDHPFVFSSATGVTNTTGNHNHGYYFDTGDSRRGSRSNKARSENRQYGRTSTAGNHSHSVTINQMNASVGNTGYADPTAVPINPAHYKVIVIRKMS